MPGGIPIKTYRGQASPNTSTVGSGITTIYVANLGSYVNNHKVAIIESHLIVFDQLQAATSSGWIHYTAPLNTGIGYGTTFNGTNPKPNLPGVAVPDLDDGVVSVNTGAGPNQAYIIDFRFNPASSQLLFRVEQISGIPNHPIKYRVNWKLTCF